MALLRTGWEQVLITEITDSLERIPAMVYIRRIIRHKYVLKSNIQILHPERKALEIADLPVVAINKCIAGASVLTDIIMDESTSYKPNRQGHTICLYLNCRDWPVM